MTRAQSLAALDAATTPWDVCVIGGGATGLGAALDATTRGYRTVLVERDDFAKATSSRSTKLIHGGVRYLRQGRVSLVMEALRERAILARNAPHLVRPLEFIVPASSRWEQAFYGIGLKAYDLLAGRRGIHASQFLSRRETLDRLPGLMDNGFAGGIAYWDAQFDDARLAITLAQTITGHGGIVLNYAPVTALLKTNGRINGVRIRDSETGAERDIHARVVINATGVFTDEVRHLDEPAAPRIIAASQGAHIVAPLDWLGGRAALMIPRTPDGRILFAIPWHGRLVLGTTDNEVSELTDEPRPMAREIEFILDTAARYLAQRPNPSQILSAFAGLRPLIRAGSSRHTASISREHAIFTSSSGLISIAGGKWTTFRKMAQDTVSHAARTAGIPSRPCITETLPLHGSTDLSSESSLAIHGSDAPAIAALDAPQLIHPRLPYTEAEVLWAIRCEMARTVEDILARRTRALLLDARASIEVAPRVANLLATELQKDNSWPRSQVTAYTQLASGYLTF